MYETIKEQREYKKGITAFVEPYVAEILKKEAKQKYGMLFGKYLEKILTEKANKIKESNDEQ